MITAETSAELADGCTAADRRVQTAAYERLAAILLSSAERMVPADPRMEHVAGDCTQEALRTVWQKLGCGQGPARESFVPWAITIVTRKVLEEFRRLRTGAQKRDPVRIPIDRLKRLDEPDKEGRMLSDIVADPDGVDPERCQEYLEIQRLVARIGESGVVSDRSRTVLLRGFIADWDDAELAAHLDTTKANVQYIRHHDLKHLRTNASFMGALRDRYPGGGR